MALAFYMDHHVPAAISQSLRTRGIDCVTAWEYHHHDRGDEALLQRATSLGRILFTSDDDFLRITAAWLRDGIDFAGLVCQKQQLLKTSQVAEDLELLAQLMDREEMRNRVEYLPLRAGVR